METETPFHKPYRSPHLHEYLPANTKQIPGTPAKNNHHRITGSPLPFTNPLTRKNP